MTLPTKPHLPVTVLGHPTFTVTLDSFRITDTRAQHNDTDYASLTVLLKSASSSGTPQTQVTYIGDVNNGTHYIGLVSHPEDYSWSSFNHYATGEPCAIAIASQWVKEKRFALSANTHPCDEAA
jgi:hypothetical protein